MAEIDNTIALGVKPQPQQDIIGPITSLAQLQYLQAHGALENAQAGFAQGKTNAYQTFGNLRRAGVPMSDALDQSNLPAYDPAGSASLVTIPNTLRVNAAAAEYAKNPTPANAAGIGPEARSQSLTGDKTALDVANTARTNKAAIAFQNNPTPANAAGLSPQGYGEAVTAQQGQIKTLGDIAAAKGQIASELLGGIVKNPDGTEMLPPEVRSDLIQRFKAIRAATGQPLDARTEQMLWSAPVAQLKPIALGMQQGGIPTTDTPSVAGTKEGAVTAAKEANTPRVLDVTQGIAPPPPSSALPGYRAGAGAGAPPPQAAPPGMSRVGGTTPAYYGSALASGDVASALRASEGLKTDAYWDVNHWRTGYGSDSVTNPDGSTGVVTANTKITPQMAEMDLQRRTALASNLAQNQVGKAWSAYGPAGQAALTSMVYNYGRLPSDVASAASSGNPQALATAIANHAGDNNGANYARRMMEAQAVLGRSGGGGFSPQPMQMPAGAGGGLAPTPPTPLQSAAALPVPAIPNPAQPGQNLLAPAAPAQLGVAPISDVTAPPAAAPVAPAPAVAPAAPNNGWLTPPAMTIGQKAELEGQGKAYGELPQKLDEAATSAKSMNTTLDEVSQAVNGSWQPGKWANISESARESLQTVAKNLGIETPGLDKSISSYQDFVKMAGNISRTAAHETSSRVGVQEMELINKSLPNPETSDGGIKLIIPQMKGLNDYKIAQQQAASQWRDANGGSLGPAPNHPGQDFQSVWNNQASPAAFVIHRMAIDNPEGAREILMKIKSQPNGDIALKNIQNQMKWAHDNGLLN